MVVQEVFSSWNCFFQKITQWHHPRWGRGTGQALQAYQQQLQLHQHLVALSRTCDMINLSLLAPLEPSPFVVAGALLDKDLPPQH
jgi:hypothetical protein